MCNASHLLLANNCAVINYMYVCMYTSGGEASTYTWCANYLQIIYALAQPLQLVQLPSVQMATWRKGWPNLTLQNYVIGMWFQHGCWTWRSCILDAICSFKTSEERPSTSNWKLTTVLVLHTNDKSQVETYFSRTSLWHEQLVWLYRWKTLMIVGR